MRYLFTPTVMAKIKKTDNVKCWQEYGATRPLYFARGNIKSYNHFVKLFGTFL